MFQRIRMGRTAALVPVGIRRIPGGLWTHSACRPIPVVIGNAIGRLSGASLLLLRFGSTIWDPPFDLPTWNEWLGTASNAVGARVTDVVVLPPGDPHRRRFALVLLNVDQRPIGFAKWTRNPANPLGLEAERRLTSSPPQHFRVPGLLDHGSIQGWTYTVNEMLPPGPHRPASLTHDKRRLIAEEIHGRLTGIAESDHDEVASHGDFAPWNVRRLATGEIAIIDWEDVRPAPVAVDETWHVVTWTLAGGGSPTQTADRARRELSHHDDAAVERAVAFLLRRSQDQPPEVDAAVNRSKSLMRFERSINQALRRIALDRGPGTTPPHQS